MLLNKFQGLGNKYCERYLWNTWDKEDLANNWWTALRFFLNHAFMRGRRDDLSEEYYRYTVLTLKERFEIPTKPDEKAFANITAINNCYDKRIIEQFKIDKNMSKNGNSIKHSDFRVEVAENNELISCLQEKRKVIFDDIPGKRSKAIYLGNDRDLMMVLDVLKYIVEDKERSNIYNHICNKLISSGVKATHLELTQIYAIGDKIAAFLIRDIGLLNTNIKIDEYEYAFPVDTWVLKIAKKLGCETNDLKKVKGYFIEKCIADHLDPLKVAAGLWYLGFNSLDIVLDKLEYINVND